MDATVDDEMVPPVEDGPSVEVNSIFDDPIEPVDDEPTSLVEPAAESMELAEAAESAAEDLSDPSSDGTESHKPVASAEANPMFSVAWLMLQQSPSMRSQTNSALQRTSAFLSFQMVVLRLLPWTA